MIHNRKFSPTIGTYDPYVKSNSQFTEFLIPNNYYKYNNSNDYFVSYKHLTKASTKESVENPQYTSTTNTENKRLYSKKHNSANSEKHIKSCLGEKFQNKKMCFNNITHKSVTCFSNDHIDKSKKRIVHYPFKKVTININNIDNNIPNKNIIYNEKTRMQPQKIFIKKLDKINSKQNHVLTNNQSHKTLTSYPNERNSHTINSPKLSIKNTAFYESKNSSINHSIIKINIAKFQNKNNSNKIIHTKFNNLKKEIHNDMKFHKIKLTDTNLKKNLFSVNQRKVESNQAHCKIKQKGCIKDTENTIHKNQRNVHLIHSQRNLINNHNHSLYEIKSITIPKNGYDIKNKKINSPKVVSKIPTQKRITRIYINDSNYNSNNIYNHSLVLTKNDSIENTNKKSNINNKNIIINIHKSKINKNRNNNINNTKSNFAKNSKACYSTSNLKQNFRKFQVKKNKDNFRIVLKDIDDFSSNVNKTIQTNQQKIKEKMDKVKSFNNKNNTEIFLYETNNFKTNKIYKKKSKSRHSYSIEKLDNFKSFDEMNLYESYYSPLRNSKSKVGGLKKYNSSIRFKNPLKNIDFNYKSFEEDFKTKGKLKKDNDGGNNKYKDLKPQISFRVTLLKNSDKNIDKKKRFFRLNYFYSENIRDMKVNNNSNKDNVLEIINK